MSADTVVTQRQEAETRRRRSFGLERFQGLGTWILTRQIFGVSAGVLLLVLPVFILSMAMQLVTRQGWNHPPDSRYYLSMMAKDMGHNWLDSVKQDRSVSSWHVAPYFFADNDPTWQLVRSRVLYPVLSIPFVWLWGLSGGSMAIPVLGDILFLWATAAVVQRLYGPAVTVIVVGAFSTVGPIFGFAWAGTDTLGMGLAAVIVALLPINRTIGKAHLAWLGSATLFIALDRQVGVLAPAMAGAGWLWELIRTRQWRNRWLGSFVVTSVVMVAQELFVLVFTKSSPTTVSHGTTTTFGFIRLFIHNLKLVTQEAVTYMWHQEHILFALLVAAGIGMVVRFKSDAAAVFLGAAASTYVITASVGFSSFMRYEMIMFPAGAVAAGSLVQLMLGQFQPAQAKAAAPVLEAAAADEDSAEEPAQPLPGRRAPRRGALGLGLGAGLAGTAVGRFLGLDRPSIDRWKPQVLFSAAVVVVIAAVSIPGSWPSTPAAPPSPSYVAAQGGTQYAMTPLAKPPAQTTLFWAFNQATDVANGHGLPDGSFDWVHATRYRPLKPADPGWSTRGKDGTTVFQINSIGNDEPSAIAFGNAVTLNRTVDKSTIKILSRQVSEYGEDVVFTVKDKFGVEHRGTATTLYPIWEANAPGEVTALVWDAS
ncbi:hypothetical protein ABH935_006876 [Catenulispora sp. GAS73]|uniref:hypothetical protein n=1 Tax=Catenulispora sp. GAS73 TaxID=3156269 RepID=UPI003516E1E6